MNPRRVHPAVPASIPYAATRPAPAVMTSVVAAGVLLLAGCGTATAPGQTTPAAPSPTVAVPVSPAASPSSEGPPSGIPSAGPAPSTTAGLTQTSLPVPSSLGAGWRYRVDPGGPEAGYQGNGQPAQARNPAEVAAGIAPLGCQPPASAPPLAQAALEVDYGRSKPAADGVGLLLKFATTATAQQFFDAYTGTLRTCSANPPAGAPSIVLLPQTSKALFGSVRTDPAADPTHPVWTEAVRLSGRYVRLLTVSTANAALGNPFNAP